MYTLYKLTSPDGKIYIGCTSRSLETRFGKAGAEYCNQARLWAAIQKFGWDSFTKEVLYETENRDEASVKEQRLIAAYRATNPAIGYNTRAGGLCREQGKVPPEVGLKISRGKKGAVGIHKDNERRYVQPEMLQLFLDDGWELGGLPCSEESKEHLRQVNKGKRPSEATRAKLSTILTDRVAIHNGDLEKKVKKEELDEWLAQGWERGPSKRTCDAIRRGHIGQVPSPEARLKQSQSMKDSGIMRNRKHINKDGIHKFVRPDEYEAYLAQGWLPGTGRK